MPPAQLSVQTSAMNPATSTQAEARSGPADNWRVALRREMAWIIALKLAVLWLLWALFFRN
jgi:hypothetical protein